MSLIQDGPYDTRGLTKIFAITSALLLAASVWMVIKDHDREWKNYQQEFMTLERSKRQAELNAAKLELDQQRVIILPSGEVLEGEFESRGDRWLRKSDGREILQADLAGGRGRVLALKDHLAERVVACVAELDARKAEQGHWQRTLEEAEARFQAADLKYKNLKSIQEARTFHYEHAVIEYGEESATTQGKLGILEETRRELAALLADRIRAETEIFLGFECSDASLQTKLQGEASKADYDALKAKGVESDYDGLVDGAIILRGKGRLPIESSRVKAVSAHLERYAELGRPVLVIKDGSGAGVLARAVAVPVLGLNGVKKRVAAIRADVRAAEREKAKLEGRVTRLTASYDKIKANFVNDYFRNRPMTDFISPNIVPKQIVVEGLTDDYFFAQIRKVDRCESCHLGIDKRDFTGFFVTLADRGMVTCKEIVKNQVDSTATITWHNSKTEVVPLTALKGEETPIAKVFQSHPKLDVYLTSLAPHPKETFGCTVCHQGEGRSMDFLHSAHSPRDEKQQAEWEKDHHWHKRHHWDFPQTRTQYIESSCLQCHANNRPVPEAPVLNFGREVWERVGCFGCHKMKGFTEERKQGPDLRKLASKLNKGWTYNWLANPANFRAKTNMPRFWFGLDNEHMPSQAGREHQANLDSAEIAAVTEYLFHQSKDFEFSAEAKKTSGNAEQGAGLFQEKGCAGCHKVDSAASLSEARSYTPNEFGPNLNNIGDKVGHAWLYSWVKNPEHYWAETSMPNLQLSDTEAHDIAAYLGTLKSDKSYEAPKPNDEAVQKLVVDFLGKEFTAAQVKAFLRGEGGEYFKYPEMERGLNLGDSQDRLLYLGRNVLTRFGCFGCHYVSGMETRPGIGAELSNIGDKELAKIDWGHTTAKELPRWREDWLRHKVKKPRFADEGRYEALGYLDRSRMPQFNLTEAEREALATFLSGHTEAKITKEYKYAPSKRKQDQIDGAYTIYRKNCKACHMLDIDTITVRRFGEPEDDVDGETMVGGKSVDSWNEVLGDSEKPMAERITAAKNLTDARAYQALKEALGGFDADPATVDLREVVAEGVLKLRKAAGYTDVGVKGVVLFDNRYQVDPRTGLTLKNGAGEALRWPLHNDDGELVKLADGREVPTRGVAVIQVWEDCPSAGEKRAGDIVAVSNNLALPSDVFYNDIVRVESAVAGAETVIPATLRAKYPQDFQPAGAFEGLRLRGGMSTWQAAWARVIAANGGEDPRVLKTDFDSNQAVPLANQLIEARSYTAPHLRKEGEKVQAPWLRSFLLNPGAKIRPWLNMRMPNYGLSDVEAQSIALYFSSQDEDAVVAEATGLLEALQGEIKAGKEQGKVWSRLDIAAAVQQKLGPIAALDYFELTIADGVLNFRGKGDVSKVTSLPEKTVAYKANREAAHPYYYSKGHEMFIASQCLSCHLWEGRTPGKDDPSSWGPDLSRVGERIRPKWFLEWVNSPQSKIPGTKMSKQFETGYSQVYDAPVPQQIELLKDWIYAGMKPAFEVFPLEVTSGSSVRLTSQMLPLDNLNELYVSTPEGVLKYSVADGSLQRELSDGRAVALVLKLQGKPGVYTITSSKPDSKTSSRTVPAGLPVFDGRAKVKVK
jgi:cbb3-type cytochrome oxidase cytochrome c subunit